MENVLRAMDVIPPFDSHHISDRPSPRHMPDRLAAPRASAEHRPQNASRHGVPTLDLGEKILAEQRRRTARTRRAPGGGETPADVEGTRLDSAKPEPVKPAPNELAQLQEIVAEIVARDIDRLCAGLARASHGPRSVLAQ